MGKMTETMIFRGETSKDFSYRVLILLTESSYRVVGSPPGLYSIQFLLSGFHDRMYTVQIRQCADVYMCEAARHMHQYAMVLVHCI